MTEEAKKLAIDHTPVFHEQDQYTNRKEGRIHSRVGLDPRAQFAASLIERWGLVAARIDGEDSSGRSKLADLTPDEVVGKAVTTAALAFEAFEAEGWVVQLPLPSMD